MKQPHTVPLSKQTLGHLKQLRGIRRSGIYLFPSLSSPLRPMCENTLNSALRRLAYGREDMISHGFRAMAATHGPWCRLQDSNLRPPHYECDALPAELKRRTSRRGPYQCLLAKTSAHSLCIKISPRAIRLRQC
jgi:hypothetical protein